MPTPQLFEVNVRRGPRELRVRQSFASIEAARAYVLEQCRLRGLELVYESLEPSEYTGALTLMAGNESFLIQPVMEPHVCRVEATQPVPTRPAPEFDDWVRQVFDHPVPENSSEAWYWNDDGDASWNYSSESARVVSYLGQLVGNAERLLLSYSDGQVAQGLEYLNNNSLSNYIFALMDLEVAWPDRRRSIQAIYVVFERVFNQRCSAQLSHTRTASDPPANPLNGACYMWWDTCPLHGQAAISAEEDFVLDSEELVDPGPRIDPYASELEAEILKILERTLALDNIACQEAALHGLGHRHYKHPEQVEEIVDAYLNEHLPEWPNDAEGESLRGYALAARRGTVQ